MRTRLVETLHHGVLHARVDVAGALALAQSEDALDDAELRGGGVEAGDGQPVVDDHAGADDVASTVDAAGNQRHLQQARELILVLDARLGVDEATLVGEAHVASHEHVVGNRLAEHLDAEDIGDDLFRLALEVGVDEGNVIVCGNDIAEGGEALLDALDAHRVGQGVAQVLQLLVRRGRGHEETLSVAGSETANDASAGNGCPDCGHNVLEFGLEDTVAKRSAGMPWLRLGATPTDL